MNAIIIFTDQSNSFTYGVEFGRLLQKIEQGDEAVSNNNFPIHVENKEVIIQACKAYNYKAIFMPCEIDGWEWFIGFKNKFSDN